RDERFTPCGRALVDLEGQAGRRKWLRTLKQDVVGFRPVAARDLIHVASAACDNKRRGRTGTLDRGVDRDGRPVDEALDQVEIKARLAHAIEHACRKMRRSRETLRLVDLTGIGVERQEVRKCATDIDGNADVLQDVIPSSYCAVMLALRAA